MSAPIERRTPPVTRTQIVRFAGAGGDFNPMHHDEPFAVAAGDESVFAMGQLTAAILATFVSEELGRDRVRSYGVRYRGKVRPGDELVLSATPGDEADGAREYTLEARRAADDEVVLTGSATITTAAPAA